MVASKVIGELALIRLTMTGLASMTSAPKRIFAISTESSARSGCVTEPMNGLSERRMCA